MSHALATVLYRGHKAASNVMSACLASSRGSASPGHKRGRGHGLGHGYGGRRGYTRLPEPLVPRHKPFRSTDCGSA